MESGGISERIVDLAMAIVGRVRGGLAMVVVVAEILFSGISGSTAADVSAISSLLVPSMRQCRLFRARVGQRRRGGLGDGHPRAAVPDDGGARIAGEPVDRDAVPGRLRAGVRARGACCSCLIALRARRQGLAGQPAAPRERDLARAVRRAAVPTGLPVHALRRHLQRAHDGHRGGAARRRLRARRRHLRWAASGATRYVGQLAQSGIVTATTLWVLAAASAFAWILVREWVPQMLGEWIAGVGAGRAGFLAMTDRCLSSSSARCSKGCRRC